MCKDQFTSEKLDLKEFILHEEVSPIFPIFSEVKPHISVKKYIAKLFIPDISVGNSHGNERHSHRENSDVEEILQVGGPLAADCIPPQHQ